MRPITITDLAKDLEGSVDRSNRVVERFLLHQVKKGLTCGTSSAQDIRTWMRREGIHPNNGCKRLILWINRQLATAIRVAMPEGFRLVEVEGGRLGINFAWWFDGAEK